MRGREISQQDRAARLRLVPAGRLGEDRVYRAYWNDGLLDVFAAVGVLAIGISWTLDFVVGGAITPALLIPLWGPFRQRFIEPRLGMVEFSDARERTNKDRLRMLVLLGVGSFVFAVDLYFLRDRLGVDPVVSLIAGLPALILAVLAALTALLVSTGRFLVYAALLAMAGVVGAASGWEPGPILVAAGLVIIDDLLHEPARLRLLAFLSVVKRTDFTYLLKLSGMSKGNLSVQMNKLGDAEMVRIDKSFQGNRPRTVYQLTDRGKKALRAYKKNMNTILAALPD